MNVTKSTSAMPSAPAASNHGPQVNHRGLTWKPLMSTAMTLTMVMMRTERTPKKHHMPMMD
jgi:hypothetical protein